MTEPAKPAIQTPNAEDKAIVEQAMPIVFQSYMGAVLETFFTTAQEIAHHAKGNKEKAEALTSEVMEGFTTSYINRFVKENLGDMLQQPDDLKIEMQFPERTDKALIDEADKDFVKKIVDQKTDDAFKSGPGGGVMVLEIIMF